MGTENDDETLQKALSRADAMSGGPLRRLQFGYVDEEKKEEMFAVVQSSGVVLNFMKSRMYRKFGRSALRDIASLFMFSRRITGDVSVNAPDKWKKDMMVALYEEVNSGGARIPREFMVGVGETSKKMDKVRTYLLQHQDAMNACWVSAAVIRGWEVYDSIDELVPVFDLRQQRMAEEVAEYLFISKLRVLAPGINDALNGPVGIART